MFPCQRFLVMEVMSARNAILHWNRSLTLCKQHHRESAVLVVYKTETKLSTFFIIVQPAKGAGIWAVIIQTYWLTLYLCKKKVILGWQDAWLLPWRTENSMGYLGVGVAAAVLLHLGVTSGRAPWAARERVFGIMHGSADVCTMCSVCIPCGALPSSTFSPPYEIPCNLLRLATAVSYKEVTGLLTVTF